MQVIAKVFDLDIYESEVIAESKRLPYVDPCDQQQQLTSALAHLIDRMLLLHMAVETGFSVSDEEYEAAVMDIIDDQDAESGSQSDSSRAQFEASKLEKMIRSRILIKKYLDTISTPIVPITEDQVLSFYEEQKEVFFVCEEVRASHILLKGDDEETLQRALKLRSEIHNRDEFLEVSPSSECPTCYRCGDLGFFPRGKLLKEIEDQAFALEVGQISQPFKTKHGYHILMVTDRRLKSKISFDEIKDSLRTRLNQLERDIAIVKHITDLRKKCKAQITIYDPKFNI